MKDLQCRIGRCFRARQCPSARWSFGPWGIAHIAAMPLSGNFPRRGWREKGRGRGKGRKGSRKEVTRRLHTGPARTLARSSTLIQSFCCRHATDIICTKEPQMPARAGLAREGTKGRKGEERKVRERRNGRRACMESPSVKKRHKSWSGKQGRELESLNSPLNRVREAPSGCN